MSVPRFAIIFFVVINFCIYLDRGIVPGAFQQFNQLINDELGPEYVGTLFGLLTSVFIAGYAIASFVVGQLVHVYPPFRIVGTGLLLWTGSVILAAVAPSYWVLLVARGLSGVGEASFQCIVAPFIDDYAPPEIKALVLGAFYAAIPMGTALGYIYGAELASASSLSWRTPFIAEAPVLLLLSIGVFFIKAPRPKGMHGDLTISTAPAEEAGRTDDGTIIAATVPAVSGLDDTPARSVTLWAGFTRVMTNWRFLFVSLGYAAYNFSLAGFGTFAPSLLVDLHLFEKEKAASTAIGATIAGVGVLGTMIGGYATDKTILWLANRLGSSASVVDERGALLLDGESSSRGGVDASVSSTAVQTVKSPREYDEEIGADAVLVACASPDRSQELVAILLVGVVSMSTGSAFAISLAWMTSSAGLYLAITGLACLCLFVSNGTAPLAMLASVAVEDRALAMGIGQIIQHALGDVPSPTIIGAMTDILAPQTPTGRSQAGLQLTLLFIMGWLVWVVLFWFAALAVSMRHAGVKWNCVA